jgi:hypothetical protein
MDIVGAGAYDDGHSYLNWWLAVEFYRDIDGFCRI